MRAIMAEAKAGVPGLASANTFTAAQTFSSTLPSDITTLVGGTSGGGLLLGQSAAHLVVGIQDNDSLDSFSIVSGSGNYTTDSTFDKLVAQFRADGTITLNGATVGGTSGAAIPRLDQSNTWASGTSQTFNGDIYLGNDVSDTLRIQQSSTSSPGVSNTTLGAAFTNGTVRCSSDVSASAFNRNGDGNVVTFQRSGTAVGSISVSAGATAFNTSSDENLKNFIGEYDRQAAIAIIRADPVRDFTWKASGSYAVGWGAQSSYAVSPDLASPGKGKLGDDDYQPWGIDQSKRTPYLWAAVSHLLDKVEDLEARLAALGS